MPLRKTFEYRCCLSPSLLYDVSGNETRIGQYFTFSGQLSISQDQAQQDKIWEGYTLLHDVSIQLSFKLNTEESPFLQLFTLIQ